MTKTLAAWMESFLNHLKYQRNVSPHTLRNYASDLAQFHRHLTRSPGGEARPEIEMEQIDNLTIREFLGSLYRRGNKKSSVARKLATLRSFMKFLTSEGAIPANPAKIVSSPRQEKRLPEHLRLEAVVMLMDAPDTATQLGKRDRSILELLYAAGIRVSELVGLDLGDIDLREGLVRVVGKGRKERIVPFGRSASDALQAYLQARRELPKPVRSGSHLSSDAIFLNSRGGRLTTRSIGNIVNRHVRKLAQRLKVHPHTLRHTFATHMLNAARTCAPSRSCSAMRVCRQRRSTRMFPQHNFSRSIISATRVREKSERIYRPGAKNAC